MNKFLIPVILIITSIGLFVFQINPNFEEIKVLKEKKLQYDEARNKSRELRIARDNLLERYNSFSKEDLVNLKKLLPDNVDNVRLVMDIDNIASEHGITITSIGIESPSEDGNGQVIIGKTKNYDFVALNFSILASYNDFINFISDLKDSLRLVDMTHVDFNVSEGSNIFRYNLSIKTYWLK